MEISRRRQPPELSTNMEPPRLGRWNLPAILTCLNPLLSSGFPCTRSYCAGSRVVPSGA
jgi:hypothetical protein